MGNCAGKIEIENNENQNQNKTAKPHQTNSTHKRVTGGNPRLKRQPTPRIPVTLSNGTLSNHWGCGTAVRSVSLEVQFTPDSIGFPAAISYSDSGLKPVGHVAKVQGAITFANRESRKTCTAPTTPGISCHDDGFPAQKMPTVVCITMSHEESDDTAAEPKTISTKIQQRGPTTKIQVQPIIKAGNDGQSLNAYHSARQAEIAKDKPASPLTILGFMSEMNVNANDSPQNRRTVSPSSVSPRSITVSSPVTMIETFAPSPNTRSPWTLPA